MNRSHYVFKKHEIDMQAAQRAGVPSKDTDQANTSASSVAPDEVPLNKIMALKHRKGMVLVFHNKDPCRGYRRGKHLNCARLQLMIIFMIDERCVVKNAHHHS